MIPLLLFFRFSPLMFIPLTLWIPPSRRLTVICTRVPLYYSYFMFRLHRRLLHGTRIERFRNRLFRIPLLIRARLRTRDNLSLSLHELSLQQLSMVLLWCKKDSNVYSIGSNWFSHFIPMEMGIISNRPMDLYIKSFRVKYVVWEWLNREIKFFISLCEKVVMLI